MPLAFAPVGWAWLAVIALATFFVLTAQSSRRQALWSAYLFGLGYFGVGVSWVFISISQYGNGPVVAVLVTAAFVSLLALFPWGVAYLVRCLRPEMDAMALWLARISHRSPASLADCAGYRHDRSFAAAID